MLQVGVYNATLVLMRVVSLKECLDKLQRAPGLDTQFQGFLQKMTLWKLRQMLAARAAGEEVTIKERCPNVHANACFDADCPAALSYGLRKQVNLFLLVKTYAELMTSIRWGHSSWQACKQPAGCGVLSPVHRDKQKFSMRDTMANSGHSNSLSRQLQSHAS